jgi:uncharacterized protein (TIGR03435 family)
MVGVVALSVPLVVTVSIWAAPLCAEWLATQSTAAADRPAFDAASVKVNKSGVVPSDSNLGGPGGHVAITNFSLRQLIAQAYNSSSLSQAHKAIFGMPHWGDSERFDIEAEVPGNPTIDQKRQMLQSLLADRFKLVVHHETRQLPVYALVMAKLGKFGPQLHTHTDDIACQQFVAERAGARSAGPGTVPPRSPADAAVFAMEQFPCGRVVGGVLEQEGPNPEWWSGGRKVTMEAIAESLGGDEHLDRPVVDRTGLSGSFDFTVEWNTKFQDLSFNPPPDTSGLSLFEAVQEQLGLRVKPGKGPVDVIVIDHVEQPSEN